MNFAKIGKKQQKLSVFCHKIKTKAWINNLRHTSLDKNVSYTYVKDGMCRFNINRDIHVQKIKVKKSNRNLFDILLVNVPCLDSEI